MGLSPKSHATRRILIKSNGEMLLEELLPPTAPQPSVSAGNSPGVDGEGVAAALVAQDLHALA